MGVVYKKGEGITNRDSSPRVLSDGSIDGGVIKEVVGVVDLAVADSTSSQLRFFRVPSNARVSSLKLYAPDLGTTTAMNIGLWAESTADTTGTAVDADFFASDFSCSAVMAGTDVVHEADTTPGFNILRAEKMIWEVLGLSSDPGTYYDVVGQLSGASDGTGALCAKMQFVI